MNCYFHPEITATGRCPTCDINLCQVCGHEHYEPSHKPVSKASFCPPGYKPINGSLGTAYIPKTIEDHKFEQLKQLNKKLDEIIGWLKVIAE